MSKVEDEVCEEIQERAKVGLNKYGVTMERDDLTHDEWLEHLQHELMDAIVYLQRLRTREQTLDAKLREWMGRELIAYTAHDPMDGPDRTSYGIAQSILALLDEVSE